MRLYSATPTAGAATGGSASVGGGGAVSGAGATGAVNTATDKLSGKYRQYLRSQRMHPYAAAASLNLAAAAAAAGQTSFVPFSSAATAVAATPTFQHLPQISCYNV
ncbi:GM19523 [Drosophila sechellia]|nr:GM19523 [Drosophila sechellia]